MRYVYLGVAILSEVIATSFLKKTACFSTFLPSVIVISGYACAFYFLSLTLKTMQVGVAYAIWSGVGIVLISLVGSIFYGQKIDAPGALGILMILVGVLVINLFSKTTVH